jgi:hypothetical protein
MRKGLTGPEADETRNNDKVLENVKVRVAGETKGESDEDYDDNDGDEEGIDWTRSKGTMIRS